LSCGKREERKGIKIKKNKRRAKCLHIGDGVGVDTATNVRDDAVITIKVRLVTGGEEKGGDGENFEENNNI
jgi:hypothetical protein